MKKLGLLILTGIFAFSFSINAQNANRGERQNRSNAGMNVTAKERASRMATELNLPDEQKEKVAVFLEKQDSLRAKRRAEFQRNQQGNREAAQADRDKIRAEMEKERIAQDAELESIIGKEKMDIYKKQREERMQRMRENRENRSRIN